MHRHGYLLVQTLTPFKSYVCIHISVLFAIATATPIPMRAAYLILLLLFCSLYRASQTILKFSTKCALNVTSFVEIAHGWILLNCFLPCNPTAVWVASYFKSISLTCEMSYQVFDKLLPSRGGSKQSCGGTTCGMASLWTEYYFLTSYFLVDFFSKDELEPGKRNNVFSYLLFSFHIPYSIRLAFYVFFCRLYTFDVHCNSFFPMFVLLYGNSSSNTLLNSQTIISPKRDLWHIICSLQSYIISYHRSW